MKTALGVDMAKRKFDAALLHEGKYKTGKFENNLSGFQQLLDWLTKTGAPAPHVCLEATGGYGEALATFLVGNGFTVSVVNPIRIKGFARSVMARSKTDKLDAKVIAQFCQALTPMPWEPPRAEIRELQALVRRYDDIIGIRVQEANRQYEAHVCVRPTIEATLAFLDAQLNAIQALIDNHLEQYATLRQSRDLLLTIPGVGLGLAARFLAEVGEISRFKSARQVAAFVGLNPRLKESGSSVNGRAKLSKMGSASLRKALYMPALTAMRYNPVLAALRTRLLMAGKPKMVAVGAVMRKLVHLMYGVLKSGLPFDDALAI
jgi:transposase